MDSRAFEEFFSGAPTQLHIPQIPRFFPGSAVAAHAHLMLKLRMGRGCGYGQLYLYLQFADYVVGGWFWHNDFCQIATLQPTWVQWERMQVFFFVTECCKNGNFTMKNWHVENECAKHQQIVSTCIQWCVLHNLYSYGRNMLIYLWFI